MHRDYITLRALVVQLLLLVLLQTSLLVGAEEQTPSTTITTTSTTVVSTKWVVITSASGSLITYTTSAFATGATLGITTIAGSIVESTQAASQTAAPGGDNMAWEGQGFRDAVLNSTNQYRTLHEASALKWNQTLASYAQDHAGSCDFKHTVSYPLQPTVKSRKMSNAFCRVGRTAKTWPKAMRLRLSPSTAGRTKKATTTTRSASSPTKSATSRSWSGRTRRPWVAERPSATMLVGF
jgi:hypothetical protein